MKFKDRYIKYKTDITDITEKEFKNFDCKINQEDFNCNICFVLSATLNEYKKGRIDIFLDSISKMTNIDNIICFFDNLKNKHINFKKKYPFTIQIVDLKIADKDNIYIQNKDFEVLDYEPEFGHSSGPNLSFYGAIEYIIKTNKYEYMLFMEWDCRFMRKCTISDIKKVINVNSPFSILGSYYKGSVNINDKWKTHLNGIAIYNINILKSYITHIKKYHSNLILKENMKRWNYDIVIEDFFKNNKYMLSLYKNTECIINLSLPQDNCLTDQYILDKFPKALIVHQKPKF